MLSGMKKKCGTPTNPILYFLNKISWVPHLYFTSCFGYTPVYFSNPFSIPPASS